MVTRSAAPARLALLCVLATTSVAHAALTVQPEDRTVDENATFRLTIRDDAGASNGDLDLTPLDRDFEVLGQQTESQFRSINGQVEAWTDWVLTLRPRHAGTLTVPSLSLGGERSAPLEIEVRPIDPGLRAKLAQRVFFTTDIEPERAYVDAQIVVRRRLHYAEGAQLYGELPTEPHFEGAVVQRLAEPRQYEETLDGQRFGVIEQAFAIFPEHSGTLEIPTVSINASVTLPVDATRYRRSELAVVSEPQRIDVLPVPRAYPRDRPWLPATNVEILEDWPDAGQPLAVGTPRARTLLVRATAATASMIPALAPSYPSDVRCYPQPPQLHDTTALTGVVGLRTETANLVATRPGAMQLAPIAVVWWDTVNAEVRTATLPARLSQVVGEPATAEPAVAPAEAEKPQASNPRPTASLSASSIDWRRRAPVLGYAAGAAALAVLLAGLGTAVRRRRVRSDPARDERRALRMLARACRGADLARVRSALDRWLAIRYAASPSRALDLLRAEIGDVTPLDALDRALYGRSRAAEFDAARLHAAIRRLPRRLAPPPAALPPLYSL